MVFFAFLVYIFVRSTNEAALGITKSILGILSRYPVSWRCFKHWSSRQRVSATEVCLLTLPKILGYWKVWVWIIFIEYVAILLPPFRSDICIKFSKFISARSRLQEAILPSASLTRNQIVIFSFLASASKYFTKKSLLKNFRNGVFSYDHESWFTKVIYRRWMCGNL